ncbi:MAG: FkbM family methyltransferase [Alphaproteobacteria bacterium]
MSLGKKIKKNLAIQTARLQAGFLKGMSRGEIETIARHVMEQQGRGDDLPLVLFSRAHLEKSTHVPNQFQLNGERFLLDAVSQLGFSVLFDVGANKGTWSTHVHAVFSDADLHAFEIVPDTCRKLEAALGPGPHMHINEFGLSDQPGAVTVFLYDSDLLSSVFHFETGGDSSDAQITSRVERGADYCVNHGITSIDFLKVDVEGAEGRVLEGFRPLFESGSIRLVQFEYNRGALIGDFLLKHAFEFFSGLEYRLGKLTPEGVHFHEYDFIYEDFVGPNYVACRADDVELIDIISRFSR